MFGSRSRRNSNYFSISVSAAVFGASLSLYSGLTVTVCVVVEQPVTVTLNVVSFSFSIVMGMRPFRYMSPAAFGRRDQRRCGGSSDLCRRIRKNVATPTTTINTPPIRTNSVGIKDLHTYFTPLGPILSRRCQLSRQTASSSAAKNVPDAANSE